MTIDLSTLKPGDKVKLRCGGEIEVTNPIFHQRGVAVIDGHCWYKDGTCGDSEHPFDIISIERKPKPRKVVAYVGNLDYVSTTDTYLTLKQCKHVCSGRIFRITLVEGEPPMIEEVE